MSTLPHFERMNDQAGQLGVKSVGGLLSSLFAFFMVHAPTFILG